MKSNITAQTVHLRGLVDTYQRQHQQLQEEVAEFVVRDVEEQNAMHVIAKTVLEAQRTSLSNPHYVRWASMHKKGEFEEKVGAPDLNGIEEAQQHADYDEAAQSDLILLKAHGQLMGQSGGLQAAATGKVDLLDRKVIDILKGFRSLPAANTQQGLRKEILQQLSIFVEDFCHKQRLTRSTTDGDEEEALLFVPFLNGSILWPVSACHNPLEAGIDISELVVNWKSDILTPQDKYAAWMRMLARRYFSASCLDEVIEKIALALLGLECNAGDVDGECVSDIASRMRDVGNTLTVVAFSSTAFQRHPPTTLVRAFVSGEGEVVTMDVLGPALNPFDTSCTTTTHGGAQALISSSQRAGTWFNLVRDRTDSLLPSVLRNKSGLVFSWVVCGTSSPQRSEGGDDEHPEHENGGCYPVLVECSTLSPDIPFNGYSSLSWSELCGLLSSNISSKAPAGLVPEPDNENISFHVVRMRVRDVSPFDLASRVWFTFLDNTERLGKPVEVEQSPQSDNLADEKPADCEAIVKNTNSSAIGSPLAIGAVLAFTSVVAGMGGFILATRLAKQK